MANDVMTLLCEVGGLAEDPSAAEMARRIADSVRETTQLRAEVQLVPPGSLPNDGRVIEDSRSLD
jgi:phenylacetate-CoA ligase